MTKLERKHLEELKKNAIVVVKEEVVLHKGKKSLKKTFSDGRFVYYTLPPDKPITCVAMGTGCRNKIPFNPNNIGGQYYDFTWERDSIYEQVKIED